MSKTLKTNKQVEQEQVKGKISYRKRVIQETEAEESVKEFLFLQRDLFEKEEKEDIE